MTKSLLTLLPSLQIAAGSESLASTLQRLSVTMSAEHAYVDQRQTSCQAEVAGECSGSGCGGAGIVKLKSGEECCDLQFCLKYSGANLSSTSPDEHFHGCGDCGYCFYMTEKHQYCQLGIVDIGAVTASSETAAAAAKRLSVSMSAEHAYVDQRQTSCQAEVAGECSGSGCGGAGILKLKSGEECCDLQLCLKYGGANLSLTSPDEYFHGCGDCSYCFFMTENHQYCQLEGAAPTPSPSAPPGPSPTPSPSPSATPGPRGQDFKSQITDPLLKDPDDVDFSLRDGSPVSALGFQQIDTSSGGPRGAAFVALI